MLFNCETVPELTKDCDRQDCQISISNYGSATALAWTPIYDKKGSLLNEDPNVYSKRTRCFTCNKKWSVRRQGCKYTIELDIDDSENLP